MNHTNVFLNQSPKTTEIKAKTTNGLNQTYKFHSKGNLQTKRQPIDWEKIFAKDMMDKDLISKIYKTAQ